MKITLAHLLLLVSTVTAAPIADPGANLATRTPLKPIHKISYCYQDGRCFPQDWRKARREAEPAHPADPNCHGGPDCPPPIPLKRSAEAEPQDEPTTPLTEPEPQPQEELESPFTEPEPQPQDEVETGAESEPQTQDPVPEGAVPSVGKKKMPIRIISYCYPDRTCFPRDWLKRADPIGSL